MKFTASHEWVLLQDPEHVLVGISNHAQKELGQIAYVELPQIGSMVQTGDAVAVIESSKAAADIYTPISGCIVAINEKLQHDPALVNSSAEKNGWLFILKLTCPIELEYLMEQSQYNQWLENGNL